MAGFPTYSLPQEQRAALPGVRFSPGVPSGAFGQDVGRALHYVGQLGAQRAVEMQRDDDYNAAFSAFHYAASATNDYLYGANGQPGLFAREGIAALGATGEAKRMFDELGTQASKSLTTEGSKFRFKRLWLQRSTTLEHSVSTFEAQQRAVAVDQVIGATKDQALQDVARNPDYNTVIDAKSNVLHVYRANNRSDIEIASVFTEIDTAAADNQIRTMIRQDPLATAQLLLDEEGSFQDRSLEWREIWRDRAMTEFEQRSRIERAEEERERKVADQREKETQKRLAKEGDALFAKGLLKTEWVEQNRDELSVADHRHFLDLLTGGADGVTDPDVFDDLYEQAREGADIWEIARQARQAKRLKQSDFTLLVNRSERGPAMPHHIKYWLEDYIGGVMGDDAALVDFGARSRKYDALAAGMDWWHRNPEATAEEAEREARRIVRSYSIVDLQQQLVSLTLPRLLVGTRMEPNIEATMEMIDSAKVDNLLNEEEYKLEIQRLNQLRKVLEMKKRLEEEASKK